ncbi:MAG: helix-turn-helix domain-containing protein [Actinomycetota bacterium]|nr:helix-turn-helix domain-containing protein [Actinomycetota bacterium]
MDDERLITLEEVAERMRVSVPTVRRWIKAGKLPATKPSGVYRVRGRAFEEFVEKHTGKAQAPPSSAETPEERRVEESDALAEIIRRLSAGGKEVAGSDAGSAELLRGLKVIDDVFAVAFRDYREREAQGGEAGSLAGAIEELVVASVAVEEAMKEAAAREADPGQKAQIVDFLEHRDRRGPARTLGLRQAEAG